MIQQLVMYEEELQQINSICDILQRDSNAKAVLVIDKNGQAIAQAGDTQQLDVTSLSSLTAGNVAATGGIAQLLAEREFAGQFHEGERPTSTSRSSAARDHGGAVRRTLSLGLSAARRRRNRAGPRPDALTKKSASGRAVGVSRSLTTTSTTLQ
jgi:hypothetical protein